MNFFQGQMEGAVLIDDVTVTELPDVIDERLTEIIKTLNLERLCGRSMFELSGGEKCRCIYFGRAGCPPG